MLKRAMYSVQMGHRTVAQAAKEFNIPRQTLQYRLFKRKRKYHVFAPNIPYTTNFFIENYNNAAATPSRITKQLKVENMSDVEESVPELVENVSQIVKNESELEENESTFNVSYSGPIGGEVDVSFTGPNRDEANDSYTEPSRDDEIDVTTRDEIDNNDVIASECTSLLTNLSEDDLLLSLERTVQELLSSECSFHNNTEETLLSDTLPNNMTSQDDGTLVVMTTDRSETKK